MLPPQSVTVGGPTVSVYGGVEAYNESVLLCQVSQPWGTYFVLRVHPFCFTLPGKYDSPGDIEDAGNARADFPNASEERNLRNISRHFSVLFEHIPGTQGIWRVGSSYRLKTTEPALERSSLSHAHHKLSAEYRRKRRLRVQNRSAGCILSCTNTSTQQEVPLFCLRKQGMSVSSTSLQSEHCPSGTYSPGTKSDSLPPSSRDIGISISRRLVDTLPRPPSVTSPPVSVTKHTEYGWPQFK